MGKHLDAFNAQTFLAPWETESGEDAEIDKDKLKTYLKSLHKDKATHQDRADDAEAALEPERAKVKEADRARKDAEKKLADSDSSGEISDLRAKLEDSQTKAADDAARAEIAEGKVLRIQVGEEKGLSPAQALRLQGATKEEIEADADSMIDLFGIAKPSVNSDDDDDDDDDETGNPLRQSPRIAGPAGHEAPTNQEYDYDKIVAGFHKSTF